MQCPKCQADMEKVQYGKDVEIDRCTRCKGLWFDLGEMEQLQGRWMSGDLDEGDAELGRQHNDIEDVKCPHCHQTMVLMSHPEHEDLWYESCSDHGIYFDAGEFAATQREAMMQQFQNFMASKNG